MERLKKKCVCVWWVNGKIRAGGYGWRLSKKVHEKEIRDGEKDRELVGSWLSRD